MITEYSKKNPDKILALTEDSGDEAELLAMTPSTTLQGERQRLVGKGWPPPYPERENVLLGQNG